jgi:hypothetical protein
MCLTEGMGKVKTPRGIEPRGADCYREILVAANESIEVKTDLHDSVDGRQNSGYALKRARLLNAHLIIP